MAEVAVMTPEATTQQEMPISAGNECRREHGLKLASSKQSKANWWTTLDPGYVWGTADAMWPVTPAALKAIASPRLEHLAVPKQRQDSVLVRPQFVYSCGRTSQIWTILPATLNAFPSQRISQLSGHKTAPPVFLSKHIPQYMYGAGRVSSIWETSPAAMTCLSRPHTAKLAEPKQLHPDYMPPKPVRSAVNEAAKSCTPSAYISELAVPKRRLDGPFRDPQWSIPVAARQAQASERVQELARPKRIAEGYKSCRSPIWKVGIGTLNAVPSNRLEELAKPNVRESMDHTQFNPDAFDVSKAALRAKASARIEELAQPLQRGVA